MTKNRFYALFPAAAAVLLLLALLSLALGSVRLSPKDFLSLFSQNTSAAYRILRFIRIPRTVGAILCGAALATSGLLIQSVLHNPLGSPNVLSMNSGAALAAVLSSAVFPAGIAVYPIAAFLGAFLSLLAVVFLGKKAGASKHSIILAGVAMNAFLAAVTDAITVFIPNTVFSRNAFRIGSLSGIQLGAIAPAAALILISLILSFLLQNRIEVLSLGDDAASSLGLDVPKSRFSVLILSSLLCGSAISIAGTIGFLGLIVPHSCRMMLGGNEMKKLLPLTALSGSILLLACDTISRLGTHEIPSGIFLSAIGGPYFFFLLVKEHRENPS